MQPRTGNLIGSAILSLYRTNGVALTTVAVGPNRHLLFNVVESRIATMKLGGDIGPGGIQELRFLNHFTRITPINETII